jgi:D-alanyl-D-alanine endopeptidase (penicillin-binding protein 7)
MLRGPLLIAILIALGSSPALGSGEANVPTARQAPPPWQELDTRKLQLRSKAALIVDRYGNIIFEREADTPVPIASVTKLMTAMVILDSGLSLSEKITITKDDRDLIRLTGSRLKYGATLSRRELLKVTLMASENRAAAALARTYPGGSEAFVDAMNTKARAIGMQQSRFADAAGLDAANVASPNDLARLVFAAMEYPLIREATTTRRLEVRPYKKLGPLRYGNTNRLLRNERWAIQLGKTGYINEAGRCLVMHTELHGTPTVMVLLNSFGKLTPFGDANRVRKWVESGIGQIPPRQTGLPSAGDGRTTG